MLKILGFKNKKPVKKVTEKSIRNYMSGSNMVWVDIEKGTKNDFNFVEETFNIHPLTIEDMRSPHSVPKLDLLQGRYMFVVFSRIYYDKHAKKIKTEEIDFCVGKNFLITVHDRSVESIENFRNRLAALSIKVRAGPDSLFHNILDVEVDGFLRLIDDMDEEVEKLGTKIIHGKVSGNVLQRLTEHRRQISNLKKVVAPERDIINRMSRGQSPYISQSMLFYFRDVYDHMFRFHLNLDAHREMVSNTFETYSSAQANTINHVIKQLTIIATIFLPLTFITGVYGMNFRVMPELELSYGYYLALGAMITIGLAMWIYFRRRY